MQRPKNSLVNIIVWGYCHLPDILSSRKSIINLGPILSVISRLEGGAIASEKNCTGYTGFIVLGDRNRPPVLLYNIGVPGISPVIRKPDPGATAAILGRDKDSLIRSVIRRCDNAANCVAAYILH